MNNKSNIRTQDPFNVEDAKAVIDLLVACDSAAYGRSIPNIDSLLDDWLHYGLLDGNPPAK